MNRTSYGTIDQMTFHIHRIIFCKVKTIFRFFLIPTCLFHIKSSTLTPVPLKSHETGSNLQNPADCRMGRERSPGISSSTKSLLKWLLSSEILHMLDAGVWRLWVEGYREALSLATIQDRKTLHSSPSPPWRAISQSL